MMTSWNENVFCVTDPILVHAVEQAVELSMIWDAMTLMWLHHNVQLEFQQCGRLSHSDEGNY